MAAATAAGALSALAGLGMRRAAAGAAGASGGCLAALLRPLVIGAPPALARGKSTGEDDGSGRMVFKGHGSMPAVQRIEAARRKMPGSQPGGSTGMHHQALQRISEQLSLPLLGTGGGEGGPLQALRDRRVRLRTQRDRIQQEEVFLAAKEFLMEPKYWTYGSMLAYQRKVLELAGGTGWRRRLSADDPSILHLEKELKVLEAMTPNELMSNHKDVFTPEAKKLIAEKASCTVKYVDQVIFEHDILRADRRWYQILTQFKKPLPQSFEDRSYMAEYDRPMSESEKKYMDDMIEDHRDKGSHKSPPRFRHIWYRHPSLGGNRWSTRPPKSFPAQWKMRPERSARLAGVGVPGGGGDRGMPWGRLAQHVGGGAGGRAWQ